MITYTDCFIINDVVYCNIGNEKVIVGDNSSTYSNGVYDNKMMITSLTIPAHANGKRIAEIGQYAFCNQNQLSTVIIKAKITQINYFAFYSCSSLVLINIPSSVVFIGHCGVSCLNRSGNPTSSGTLSVFFDYPSSIKTIGNFGFERKSNVIVYFGGTKAPYIGEKLFYGSSNVTVYSPTSINFGPYETVVIDSKFFSRNFGIQTCKNRNRLQLQLAHL